MATSGRNEPASVDQVQISTSVAAMMTPISGAYMKPTTGPPMRASIAPSRMPTRPSRQTILKKSEKRTSPTAMARMIIADACEPELPPAPVSSGTNRASTVALPSSAS